MTWWSSSYFLLKLQFLFHAKISWELLNDTCQKFGIISGIISQFMWDFNIKWELLWLNGAFMMSQKANPSTVNHWTSNVLKASFRSMTVIQINIWEFLKYYDKSKNLIKVIPLFWTSLHKMDTLKNQLIRKVNFKWKFCLTCNYVKVSIIPSDTSADEWSQNVLTTNLSKYSTNK